MIATFFFRRFSASGNRKNPEMMGNDYVTRSTGFLQPWADFNFPTSPLNQRRDDFSTGYASCGYGSIPIHTIFRGMNIHKSQLFWCELQGYYWFWHTAIWSPPGHGSMASRLHLFWTKPLRRGLRQIVAPWGASTASTWHGFAQSWGPSGDVGWQMGWFAQAEWVGTLWLCQT